MEPRGGWTTHLVGDSLKHLLDSPLLGNFPPAPTEEVNAPVWPTSQLRLLSITVFV